MENYKVIGKRVEGADEKEKAKGTVVYADDFTLPGMIYGKVFRSTIPFGKIKKLDISKALALEGVETIITAADVPNNESVSNVVGQTTEVGLLEAKHQVLARNIVRYYGEPIALIAAKTYEIACDAAELIEVEYEEMKGVFDPVEAMKPEAPKIHGDNNIIEAGVRDVVLLNSNGLTIEESNVTYINGIKVDSFTDHHSGFYKIEAPDTVTVEENKQMTNWNRLEIDGTLIIDGELILK